LWRSRRRPQCIVLSSRHNSERSLRPRRDAMLQTRQLQTRQQRHERRQRGVHRARVRRSDIGSERMRRLVDGVQNTPMIGPRLGPLQGSH
jgi:hypothetical protein